MKSEHSHTSQDTINEFIDNFNYKLFIYIAKRSLIFILLLLIFFTITPILVVRYTKPKFKVNSVLIYKKNDEVNDILSTIKSEKSHETDNTKISRDFQLIISDALLDRSLTKFELGVELSKRGLLPFNSYEIFPYTKVIKIGQNTRIYNPQLFNQVLELDLRPKSWSISYTINGHEIEVEDIPYNKALRTPEIELSLSINNSSDANMGIYNLIFRDYDEIKKWIQNNIDVSKDEKKGIISISSKTHNTNKAIHVINTIIENFLEFDKLENQSKTERSLAFIEIQLDSFKRNFNLSEQKILMFKQQNDIYDPERQLKTYMDQIATAEMEIRELDKQLGELIALKNSSNNKISPALLSRIESKGGSLDLSKKLSQRNSLLLDYKPEHPVIQSINQQIQIAIAEIRQHLAQQIKEREIELQHLRSEKARIKSNLNNINNVSSQYGQFEKESNLKEKFILDLLDRKNQLQVMKSAIVSDYMILQQPKIDDNLIAPKSKIIYSISIILFLALSLLLILYRYITFKKVVSLEIIKKIVKVPNLGIIPFVEEAQDNSTRNKNSPITRIVVKNNSKSRITESFRTIRANLKYTHQNNFKTIAATSTISGEGKTFILINLATVFAQLNKKVIILDLDLRKPRIAKSFNLDNQNGMSLILSKQVHFRDCIQSKEGLDNVDFITSGPIPPNPSELIQSDEFNDLIDELKNYYDMIFIDTAPIGLVSETIEIINKVDVPIYIVRANYSQIDFLHNINNVQNILKEKPLYMILNQFGSGASSYINQVYGYGYGYDGYGYGSSYGHENGGYYVENSEKKKSNMKFWAKWFQWEL